MKKDKLLFAATLLLAIALAFGCVYGIPAAGVAPVTNTDDGIRLGLDLVGGSYMTFEARDSQLIEPEKLAADMSTVVELMQGRLDSLGYPEATVTKVGTDRVTVEIPSVSDPEEAERKLGSTAELLLLDSDGQLVCSGADILSASPQYGRVSENGPEQYYVLVSLTEAGRQSFYDATARMSTPEKKLANQNYIVIVLDGDVQSTPGVSHAIDSSEFIIEGGFTEESVQWLSHVISAGRLPFALDLVDSSSIGPTLGERSLETSLASGGVGLALVMLYMLVFYRLPGLVADLSLVIYTLLVALTMSALRINLSLPGIAGIILSIGMAVDANIVIFERIKEELRTGKTVRSSVKAGFSRASVAIFDSNITTIIAGLVLKLMGSGQIVSFANTLLIGVVLSMFTAIVVSRLLLMGFVSFGAIRLSLYGVKEQDRPLTEPSFSFTRRLSAFLAASLLVFAVGIGSLLYKGFELDVDFTGGTKLTVDAGRELSREEMDKMADIVETAVHSRPTIQRSGEGTVVILKLREQDAQGRAAIFDALERQFAIPEEGRLSVQSISPVIGRELAGKALTAVGVAALLMLVYIALRFELLSGFTAVVMLLHDLLVLLTFYTLLGLPVSTGVMAAGLTIIGYSINDTIVVFDRIRENRRLYPGRTFSNTVDLSVAQTMTRSVGTTVTTLLTVGALYFLGVTSIRAFALPLIIGIVAGFYSSVFLAGPLWAGLRHEKK